MFKELTEELLDLTVVEKGYGNALYARLPVHGCACCTCCTCLFLC